MEGEDGLDVGQTELGDDAGDVLEGGAGDALVGRDDMAGGIAFVTHRAMGDGFGEWVRRWRIRTC